MSERDLDDLLLFLRETANPADEAAASEARVLDRLDRTLASRPHALRAAFRSTRRCALALVAAAGVATGAAATAGIALALPSDPPPSEVTFPVDPANPTRLSLSAVERSTQRPSRSFRALLERLSARTLGSDPADARGIRAQDGTQAWVLAGPGRTCFSVDNVEGSGVSCASNARAARGGLAAATVVDGMVQAVYLTPDDVVSAEAGGRTFRPHNNLLTITHPVGTPVTFTMKSGDTTVQRN